MKYPKDFINKIICGDCLEVMRGMPDGCINLIIVDPPYNIKKAKWDRIDNYIEWCGKWFLECQRTLKDNGSFYWFHNYMPTVAELMIWLERNTRFVFKQFVIWNKRFNGARNQGFLNGFVETSGLRNYQQMTEYILFYTFQDETGLTTVKLDLNNFTSLRQYFKDYQGALGLTKKRLIDYVGQPADHCFRWGSSQWDMPTPETYAKLAKLPVNNGFLRREYEDLRREYEDLRREYEDLRYTFNNQKTHHSVWDYEIVNKQGHVTPKPLDLTKNIILHSSSKNDLILDLFSGSGTTALACKELSRKFVSIEINPDYCNIAEERLAQGVL